MTETERKKKKKEEEGKRDETKDIILFPVRINLMTQLLETDGYCTRILGAELLIQGS